MFGKEYKIITLLALVYGKEPIGKAGIAGLLLKEHQKRQNVIELNMTELEKPGYDGLK